MFVISYCQIYSFHRDLKLDKIVIYRSFQQNAEEIYSLDHFFFDPVTFDQMKDTATNVLVHQKSTSVSELFSVELKFTTDTLVKWFNCNFKSKFLELGEIQKQIFTKENPVDFSKTCRCICRFQLSSSAKEGHKKVQNLIAFYDFTVQQEYLVIRNNYKYEDLSQMENLKSLQNFYEAFSYFLEVLVMLDLQITEVSRLTIFSRRDAEKQTCIKTKFSQFNGKRLYFSDGINSLPLSHPYLEELAEYEREMAEKIEKYFSDEKENLLANFDDPTALFFTESKRKFYF